MTTCSYLLDDEVPEPLRTLRSLLDDRPLLGALGDLLDDLERLLPPSARERVLQNKAAARRPILEYIVAQLAKYEDHLSRLPELISDASALDDRNPAAWQMALQVLLDLFQPLNDLTIRGRTIEPAIL